MELFKRRKKTRADPVGVWLQGGDPKDILCPTGYTPLSKNPEIRRCVYKIADLVSSMTIMLMENGENGDRRIKNNLSKKIDISPNQNMGRKNFIHKIVTDMLIQGNSVCTVDTSDGLIQNINPMDMDRVTYRETNGSYLVNCGTVPFQPEEVLHFVFNPCDDKPYKGQGVTPLVMDAVENLLQANATKTGFLKSKWKPSLIITINSDEAELQDETTRRRILGSYTKTTEAGEPWLIPAGEIDVKSVQPLTLNDLAIQSSIELDKKTVAAAIGIPSFMVGIGSFNKEEYNNFISTIIMSIATIIQQELTKKLIIRDDWYFKLNPKSLLQYNLSEKMGFVKDMVSGGMLNRNEGRCEFDYPPADVEGMNDYIVLENYVPVSKVGDQKKLKDGEQNE